MNKRRLHHKLVGIRHFPKLAFLVLALTFSVVAVFALRSNNQRMLELRQAVFIADEQDGDIEGALHDLREHVHAHMNTDLSSGNNAIKPPIQLKHEYERLLAEQQKKLSSGNTTLYTDAQEYCEAQNPAGFLGRSRLGCIQEYIDKNGKQAVKLDPIDESLYKFDFISPGWSPDLAGWSIVIAAVSLGVFVLLVLSELALKRYLKH